MFEWTRLTGPVSRLLAARGVTVLLLSVLLCVGAHAAVPAPPLPPHQRVWQHWTVEQGLPQITVTSMARDHAGYLWLGTQDGLSRFDGLSFRNYGLKDHPGLGHSMVSALAVDARGQLWIGTIGGVARMEGNRIVALKVPAPGTGAVSGLHADPTNGMWISAERGLFLARDGQVRAVRTGHPEDPMTAVVWPAKGRPLAVGAFGLLADPLGTPRWLPFGERVPPALTAVRGPDGALWIGTLYGLYRTDFEGRPLGPPQFKGREVTSVAFDDDGTVWAATDSGLWRAKPDGTAERVTVPAIDSNAWIGSVLIDPQHTLWVGTQLTGLHRGYAGRFRRYTARDGLVDGAVWSVYSAPDGELWAGTTDGLYRGGLGGFRKALDTALLPHPTVLAMLEDRKSNLWIGTYAGLSRWAPGASQPVRIKDLGDAGISGLLEQDDGTILVAASFGLLRLTGDRAERIKLPGPNDGVLVNGLVRGRDGRLWVGYEGGVAWLDGTRWVQVPGTAATEYRSASLTPFDDGVLGTGVEGFYFANRKGMRVLGRAEGLHVDVVHSVRVDARNVWYQAAHGVGRIPAEQLRELLAGRRKRVDVRVYGDLGAPQVAECNGGQQDAAALTDGRWLWCPSLQGLLALDLTRVDLLAPPVASHVLAIVTPRRRIEPGRGALRIALKADERDLQIEFTAPDLRQPGQLNFKGRLVGYDTQWKPLGKRRTAFYTNLPAGDYTYELQARNADGVDGPVTRVGFSIAPRWYETVWALLAGIAALALAGWTLMRWRLAALNHRRAILEERVRTRTAELQEANRLLEAASLTDPLTGLHNRRFLLEQMPHEIARVDRAHNLPQLPDTERHVLAFLHIDLDGFKHINDAHGHHVGDQVLRVAADLLRANTRDADFAVRWGGEEFLVVARDITRAAVAAWAMRIVEGFRNHAFETDAGPLHVTCSVGHAVYPPMPRGESLPWESVLQMADAATYLAKRGGRDRSVGIELLRSDVEANFGGRLHQEPLALAEEGWIRIESP